MGNTRCVKGNGKGIGEWCTIVAEALRRWEGAGDGHVRCKFGRGRGLWKAAGYKR